MSPAAYAIINLSAVRHNITIVKQYAPHSKIMAVIKANAYGHGLLRIAEGLQKIDAMAVARLDEAMELRVAGYTCRIAVLGGFVDEQELNELVKYDLEIVVHSITQVDVLEQYLGQMKVTVWLKLDTGMNRLGFKVDEFKAVYQRLLKCTCVNKPISLMSHFSSSDNLSSSITQQQMSIFNQLLKSYPGEKSIANSAAIICWPDTLVDWVRPGIMLYGVSPFADGHGKELGLQPVMSLCARLMSVKEIKSGEAVGYSGAWVSQVDMRLGVVAIGYGDGYPRAAKQGTPILVNGKRVSLVGRVSMDMITVDLSGQPDSQPGDPVILWGGELPVEEIARCSDTIPYTLLCGITQRVEIKQVISDSLIGY